MSQFPALYLVQQALVLGDKGGRLMLGLSPKAAAVQLPPKYFTDHGKSNIKKKHKITDQNALSNLFYVKYWTGLF